MHLNFTGSSASALSEVCVGIITMERLGLTAKFIRYPRNKYRNACKYSRLVNPRRSVPYVNLMDTEV